MVKIKKIVAFSLVEALVSLIIVAILAIGALPTLTRLKQRSKTTGQRGQFICFKQADGTYYQRVINERTGQIRSLSGSGCQLKFNRRPEKYFIMASGKRNGYYDPEIYTQYAALVNDTIQVEITDDGTYVGGVGVYPSKSSPVNGLIKENAADCRLLTAGQAGCETGYIQSNCEIKPDTSDNNKNKVVVNCYKNGDTNMQEELRAYNIDIDSLQTVDTAGLDKANKRHKIYQTSSGNYRMNISTQKSSYIANNTVNGTTNHSQAYKLLEAIPAARQSEPTRLIKNLNYTKTDTSLTEKQNVTGWVYIIW